jgi:polyisoprenyl-phosphate glycosyltransferase
MTPDKPSQTHKPRIAVILPTYNEEDNVPIVLETLRNTSMLDEIIIVDDGSKDNTVEVLNQNAILDTRIQILRHDQNKGKGQAIFTGWAATSAPVILLLDADLKSLTPEHIHALLAPVIDRRADMTLGLFRGGHFLTDFSHWLTPFLTGQRGLRADLLKNISQEAAKGYGFEVALSVAAHQCGYRTRLVFLKGVWHRPSEFRDERGIVFGWLWRCRMYGQIIRAWIIATRERYPKVNAFFSDISKY